MFSPPDLLWKADVNPVSPFGASAMLDSGGGLPSILFYLIPKEDDLGK